jgi:ABC-type sugar transport system ATPase subunit
MLAKCWGLPGWWGRANQKARCLFGADAFTSGVFELDGVPYQPRDPLYALDQGVALVPEDRKKEGAVLGLSIRDNLSLSCLLHCCTGAGSSTPAKRTT